MHSRRKASCEEAESCAVSRGDQGQLLTEREDFRVVQRAAYPQMLPIPK